MRHLIAVVVLGLGAVVSFGCSADTFGPGDAGADGATPDAANGDAGPCAGDVTKDPKNCGRCGNVCASGSCVAGACDHIVFATSAQYDGNLGGTTGADKKCNALATAALLPGEYVAWASVTGDTALGRLYGSATPPPGRWVLTDKTTVVATGFDGLSQPLLAPIARDEKGAVVAPGQAITNTRPDGTTDKATGTDCARFTSTSGGDKLCAGAVGSTGPDWSVSPTCTWACDFANHYHLYCFQK